ncbi:MAG: tRNA uridine-5-carboxymethylaminomethyl(34) synthesis GTPase MnmE [Planctomycetota bacterium]
MLNTDDTIVAIASPHTPAIRGIVRLSGPETSRVLQTVLQRDSTNDWPSRSALRYSGTIRCESPIGPVPSDVLHWPTRRSYTGQPSAEIHTVGSLPVLESIVDAVVSAGGRPAQPGEFTMRAFLAGRLDLTQAEAVLGVIDAEKRGSLDHALRQLAGNVSRPLEKMRSDLLNLLADVEAGLDFVDEDIQFISQDELRSRLRQIDRELGRTIDTMSARQGQSDEARVVFCGLPNAGKSRLLNAIAERDVAIVADLSGTTRDVVTTSLSIHGHQVRFIDTAGFESEDALSGKESLAGQAQSKAQEAISNGDILVRCVDVSIPGALDKTTTESDLVGSAMRSTRRSTKVLRVATKIDLLHPDEQSRIPTDWMATSGETRQGIDALLGAIVEILDSQDRGQTGSVVGTAARCRHTLESARVAVQRSGSLLNDSDGQEFIASELRLAVNCLGEVTGAVYTDDILDRVFSRFCIGK